MDANIRNTGNPSEIKFIGDRININNKEWIQSDAMTAMTEIVCAKFNQSRIMKGIIRECDELLGWHMGHRHLYHQPTYH